MKISPVAIPATARLPTDVAPAYRAFTAADWALMATVAILWGASFLFIDIGVDHLRPELVALLRLVFGVAVLSLVPAARAPLSRGAWPRIALLAIVWMAVPFVLFPLAEQRIASSLAGMINASAPLFTVLAAVAMYRRVPALAQAAGLLVGFLGVIAVVWPSLRGAHGTATGVGLALLATALYGVAFNLAAPLQHRHGALPVVWRAQIVAMALLAPWGLAGIAGSTFTWSGVLAVAMLGVLSTAIAFVAFVALVGRVGSTRASITVYFLPAVAILLGAVVRAEALSPLSLAGAVLVAAGAYATSRGNTPAGRPRARLALIAALLFAAPGLSRAERPMTPEDVARLEQVASVEIAPGGGAVAYVLQRPRIPFEDEDGPAWAELHVVTPDGTSRPYVTGEIHVSHVTWTPDGSRLAFTAKRGNDEHTALYQIPLIGGEARRILEHEESIGDFSFSPDASRVAFVAREALQAERESLEENGFDAEVYEERLRPARIWVSERGADGEYGEPRMLPPEGHASSLAWCPGGDLLLAKLAPSPLIDDSFTSTRFAILDPASGEIRTHIETPGELGPGAWSPDCHHVAFVAAADVHDPAPSRLTLADAASGAFRDLWPDYPGHVRDVAWSGASTLLVLGDEGVETLLYAADLQGASEVRLAAGDRVWDGLSVAEDGTVAMLGESARFPDEAFLLPADVREPRRLTESNPWLSEIAFGSQETFTWTARDGLELEGVLIRPLGEQAGRRYPLILTVHGGPESHDRDGWKTRYTNPGQVAAGRGFAVLYPNYRGSTGRGVEFARSAHGQPAQEEFDDLVDAVDALVESGLADRDKVGITGGSYGGYATAWGSTRYSERFAAGVMFVGISNKISKLGTTEIPEELYLGQERKRLWEDWQHFLEASPIYYVERARTPLLIMGGTADTRVDPGQSLELHRHLKTLGQAPVRLVRYPGESHGNRRAASRYDYNLRMLRWFEHYLQGPDGDKPPAEIDYPLQEEAKEDEETGNEDDGLGEE